MSLQFDNWYTKFDKVVKEINKENIDVSPVKKIIQSCPDTGNPKYNYAIGVYAGIKLIEDEKNDIQHRAYSKLKFREFKNLIELELAN